MTQIDRREFLGAATASSLALATTVGAATESPAGPWTGGGDVPRGGGIVHYRTLGEGPPIVVMPKVGGWIADWRKVAPLLASVGQIIAIDPPGHGGSTMFGQPPFVQTVAESAAMIIAALDELGIDRFAFAGNSLGGVIGVTIAAFWPERLTKLALVGVSLNSSYGRDGVHKLDAAVNPAEWGKDWLPLPRVRESNAKFGTIDPSIDVEQDASRAKAGRWVRPSERGVALAGTQEKLSRITAPTLIVNGDTGPYNKYESIARQKIGMLQIEHIHGSGAFVHQEKPVETAALLRAFSSPDWRQSDCNVCAGRNGCRVL